MTIISFPVGSVVEGAPPLPLELCLTIRPEAIVGTPLPIDLTPVYQFGDTATGDNGPIVGTKVEQDVTPTVLLFKKTDNAPESERPPGSTWPYTYTLTVDIANTATINPIRIADPLPSDFQYDGGGIVISGGQGCSVTGTPPTDNPGGNLEVTCTGNTVGTDSESDIQVQYSGYIVDILDETACSTDSLLNNAVVDATYVDQLAASNVLPATSSGVTVTAKHVAVQKSASPASAKPGQTITYALALQVTDFGDVSALTLTDTLPDGVEFDADSVAVNVGGTDVTVTPDFNVDDTTGTTTVVLDIGSAYFAQFSATQINAGTAISVSYDASILQTYRETGEGPVRASDSLPNTVDVAYDLVQGAATCNDGSAATVGIEPVELTKVIVDKKDFYAPGEQVHFRLTMEVPSGDTRNIIFKDFLPLPVFKVADLDLDFDGADIKRGPQDTAGLTPDEITVDAPENALIINWPSLDSGDEDKIIQVDLYATVTDDPFADELFLTNILQAETSNTPFDPSVATAPINFKVRAPVLEIGKVVSNSTNSDSTIDDDGNLSDADAGDKVTYEITLENTGGADAYEVTVKDPPPTGLEGCSVSSVTVAGLVREFTGTLEETDGLVIAGVIAADQSAVITYVCTLAEGVNPREVLSNEATATWASGTGATPFPEEISDDATVTVASPEIKKGLIPDSPVSPGPDWPSGVVPGDTITYQLTVTLPEGTTPGLTLVDTLPAGFGFVSDSVLVVSAGFTGTVDTTPSVSTSGQTITLNFGEVIADGSEGITANSFLVTYEVQVLDDNANSALSSQQSKKNTVSLDFTDNPGGSITDDYTLEFSEPNLPITKTFSQGPFQAGEEITITLKVENTGTAPAFDIVVTDQLNAGANNDLLDLSTVEAVATPTGYGSNLPLSSGVDTVTYSSNSGVSLAPGDTVTFTFKAKVRDEVVTGSTFTNTADVDWDSQDGTQTNEREGNTDDTADADVAKAAVSKDIFATSEDWTDGSELAIGEVVTYRLRYTIPRGVTESPVNAAIFADTLPAGQQFLVGTATIQASATGVSIADGTWVTGVDNNGELPTEPTAIEPTVVDDSSTPLVVDEDLDFPVGTVTVQSTVVDAQITILFDALVLNTSSNNHNNTKTNTATLNYVNREGNTQSQTDTRQTLIVEPLPAVAKSVSSTTASGGDTLTFTVVASAADTGSNRTRLWDAVVTDDVPTQYQALSLTSAELSRGKVNLSSCGGFSGQILTLKMDCLDADQRYLDPGETITLTYTATLAPEIAFEEVVTNTAVLQGTSLPGSNGTGGATPGVPDSNTGERTGSGALNTSEQAVNDLSASNSATVTADKPSLTKVVADKSLQIGEITTATIKVSVPVGQTDEFVITDDLPAGLRYTGTAIDITLPTSNFTTSKSPSTQLGAGSDPLVFNFGTVVNSATTSQEIVIRYEVQVENVIGNQRNTQLKNNARLTYTGAAAPVTADATITVREPALALAKTITGGTPAVAGSEVSYQLTVSNTDDFATAYRMDLSDLLPPDLLGANDGSEPYFTDVALINPSDAVLKSAGGVLTAADADQTTATNTLAWPAFNLPPNTTLTITYKATVVDGAVTGTTLTNEVQAGYNSLPTGTDGRDGSDVLDDTDPTELDNYGQTTSNDLTLNSSIALQKTLTTGQPDANFAIGEEVLFDVKVSLLAGVTNNVVVTDTLPAGLEFIDLVGINAESGVSYNGSGTAVESPTGTVTVTLGNVTIAPEVADKSLTLQFKAQVRNIASNQNGEPLTNNAAVTSDIGDASDALDVTVVEPVLQVTKTPDTTVPALGNQVTYTVVVSHTAQSTAHAFDVELTDLIPAGLSYVVGSTTSATVDENDPTAPVFSFAEIANGDTKTFSYRATVDLDAVVGGPLQNQISGTFASTADGDGSAESGRNGSDGESGLNDYVFGTTADVTPATTAFLYPVKTVSLVVDGETTGLVDPGDTLEYMIVLTNEGADATGVVFTDTIPANTTYVASSLSTTVGTTDDTGAPNLQVDIGDLAADATVTITFRVTVDTGTATGTVISNQGAVDSEQTVPTPTDADGLRDNGFQPTDIPVGGQPSVQSPLYAEKGVVLLTDVDDNGVVNPGDTLRYSLVLSNNGDQPLTNVSLKDTIPAGLTYVNDSASATGGTPTVNGQSLDWTLETLAAGDFALLLFNVTVNDPLPGSVSSYTFENQGATDSDETQPGLTDGNGDPSDGFQPTEIEATTGSGAPVLDVEKRWSLAEDANDDGLANPGDVIGYRISITNSGSAATVDARLTDAIPTGTTLVSGSVTTDVGVVTGTDPIAINLGTLLPGEVATVRFQVTIDGGVVGGTIIENQGTVTGNNFTAVLSDDNGNPADGRNPTQTPVVNGDDSVATPGGLTKTLVETSEAASTGTNVLIGEVVTFRVGVQVPPGTLRDALIEDVLPAGLGYLPGTGKLSRTFTTGLNAAQNPGDINAEPSGDFVDLIDDTELQQDGQTLSLLLGDVINSDAAAATYTLQYQAVVLNAAANVAGETLSNEATLHWLNALNQSVSLTSVSQTLTVLEPALAIAKAANPSVIVPDGTTTFTLTITHPSGANRATAYDVQLTDLFTNWDSIDPSSITATPSGDVSGVDTSTSTTSALNVSVGTFPVGGQLVITVEATDKGENEDFVDNTVNLTWTSLPGEQGTNDATPGDPGAADGERTGSGVVPNNYTAADTERVRVVDVNFTKDLNNAQTRYAIGDEVEYRLTVTLPPDLDNLDKVVLENSVITDVLDAGLVYVTGSLDATLQDGDITASPSLPADFTVTEDTPQTGETTLTINVGTLTNNNTTEARTLVLTYKARVADVDSNVNNQQLDNAATFDFQVQGNPSPEQLSDAEQIQVGEPDITLLKTITSATTDLDAGSTVSFQVVASNDGTTVAYDTVLSDTLPSGLQDITSLQVTATSGGAPTPTFLTFTENDQSFASDAFDLPVGGSVTLTFSATLTDDVQQGQTIQNQVLADYDSRDGDDENQRDYDADDLSPVITVNADVTLDKAFHPDAGTTEYTIGEEFQYRLTLGIIEGVTRAVSVVDTLPDGVTYLDATVGLGNNGMSTQNPIGTGDQPTDVTGQVLTFNFGDITNPTNSNADDDVITIDIRVRVDNIAANVSGTTLRNNAYVDYRDGQDDPQRVDFDADAGEDGIQPLDTTVVEPVLDLEKTADRPSVALGTEVQFTLSIAHTVDSGSNAFDLVVVDTLPAGLTYVDGSASPAPTSVTGDSSTGQVLTFELGSLTTATGQTQVTLSARAEIDLVIGQELTNSASLTWASQPEATGAANSGRTGPLNDTDTLNGYVSTSEADVTPTTPAFLYPVKTVALIVDGETTGQVDPGDTLEYTIVLTNEGADATGVVFTDSIPANTTYVANSATLDGSQAGTFTDNQLTIDIGVLAADATVTITFRVTVNGDTATGTVISNQGSVDSEQTVPTPTDADGLRDNGFQPTDIPVGGQPSVQSPLYAEKGVVLLNDVDDNGVVNPGDTLRYSLVLSNNGDQPLTNVSLKDTIPTGLTYVNGSANATGGTPTVNGQSLDWTLETLAAGDFALLLFNVTVNDPLPGSVSSYTFENQGATDSDETQPGLTDGNGDPSDGFQPTEIEATTGSGAPVLDVEKRWSLAEDANDDGLANPGDVIGYRISITNSGSAATVDARLTDAIPTGTTLVSGSVTTDVGV
ncbi:isopeptide-forming domain-containing fimbrial protein, partial [Thiorhodococcus mannitoliphagus]|uniref:isopeptide-forming domain-containing fimbrial protein n=1 Tax=Thiorhodococcus mannitoliphagus TaxID=329406 RepID=UPI0013DF8608